MLPPISSTSQFLRRRAEKVGGRERERRRGEREFTPSKAKRSEWWKKKLSDMIDTSSEWGESFSDNISGVVLQLQVHLRFSSDRQMRCLDDSLTHISILHVPHVPSAERERENSKRQHTNTLFSAVCFFLVIRYTTTDSLYRFKLLYKVEIKSQVI